MSCDILPSPLFEPTTLPSSPLFFAYHHWLQCQQQRTQGNKVGAIIHAIANRVLGNYTAKNIIVNVNYAKNFMQGTIMKVLDGHVPRGGENPVWKLTVEFVMPSDDPDAKVEVKSVDNYQQHCTLGNVPASKNPPCSVFFIDLIGNPNLAVKGLMAYLPNTQARVAIDSVNTNAKADASTVDPCISLLPAPCIAATAYNAFPASAPAKKKRKKTTQLWRHHLLPHLMMQWPQLQRAEPVNLCKMPM
jgi:hypothetical protein